MNFMGYDNGNGLCRLSSGIDTHVTDEVARFVDRLQTLEGDVLKIGIRVMNAGNKLKKLTSPPASFTRFLILLRTSM